MCYKQKCKVVSLNLAHPVQCIGWAKLSDTTLRMYSVHVKASLQ